MNEVRETINAMRKAKLLSRGAIMTHIGKNNAVIRRVSEQLVNAGCGDMETKELHKLRIWNEYLHMELERVTKIPQDMRKSPAITQKPSTTSRIKASNNDAATAWLSGKR